MKDIKTQWIRFIYLYLFATIGLIVTVFGCIRGINIVLTQTVFKQANVYTRPIMVEGEKYNIEEQEKYQLQESQRQFHYEVAGALSMLLVGIPLYLFHWKLIQKEQR
jgi:hypothetical protein